VVEWREEADRMSDKAIPDVVGGRATRDIEAGEVVKVEVQRSALLFTAAERLLPGIIPLQVGADGRVYQWDGRKESLLVMGLVQGQAGEE
jgi:hypothetical protein